MEKKIAYVSQDSPVISGTLKENLIYGIHRKVTNEECIRALKLANLDKYFLDKDGDLHCNIFERGRNLSGGERQRLALARAFLKKSEIIVLDEATASLDSDSERVIQQALSNFSKDSILLVIAHRISTIADADQIIFLENGVITGLGKHDELIAHHEAYKRYVNRQNFENATISV